ncbi:MAG: 3-dehydroquinate synthase [Chloroflexi bacterium]|nr:3-dehydroquinate synthase [Chloroflexota bacterium]
MSSPNSSVPASERTVTDARAVQIKAGPSTYEALVGPGAAAEIGPAVERAGLKGRPRVIADRNVWERFGSPIEASLRGLGRDVQVLATDGGEEQKHLASVEAMYDWLIQVGTDRGDFVVAVGGGVIGDMAGYVAATYLRGIPVVQVPTTLLAQVDSSIGGKTGVDHRLGKNLIGAFHQPSLVVADTRLLESLPAREYRSGWSEIVKMAMIRDAELFSTLEGHAEQLLNFEEPVLLGDVIRRAIELKGEVVGADERESGLRIILNYGHTIGHALEAATGYRHLLHGEAVAIGMRSAGFIARQRSTLAASAFEAQQALLGRFGLPNRADGIAAADLLGPLSRDKKARGSTIQWVFANGIGTVTTARDVTADEVAAALREIGCN